MQINTKFDVGDVVRIDGINGEHKIEGVQVNLYSPEQMGGRTQEDNEYYFFDKGVVYMNWACVKELTLVRKGENNKEG